MIILFYFKLQFLYIQICLFVLLDWYWHIQKEYFLWLFESILWQKQRIYRKSKSYVHDLHAPRIGLITKLVSHSQLDKNPCPGWKLRSKSSNLIWMTKKRLYQKQLKPDLAFKFVKGKLIMNIYMVCSIK